MTVTFYSNFLMHHQTPFCENMVKLIGTNFTFVVTERIPQEQLDLGYRDLSTCTPYAIITYEDDESYQKALKLGLESDIVMIGSAPDIFIRERLKQNKLTFRYSERYFKQGLWRILDPRVLISHYIRDFRYRTKNLYMLCASAYTAPDCRFIFSYPHKTYTWGYFPKVKQHNIDELLEGKRRNNVRLLWVGRFVEWKHPEIALKIAQKLIKNGYDIVLDVVGGGVMEQELKAFVKNNVLENRVNFLGTMPPERVLENMEKADIFMFTSNRKEGWGAVLNESMSSGCAVVASRVIGSVPFLIKDGVNGMIYDDRKPDNLYRNVELLVKDRELREKFGRNAYLTMQHTWNADNAATKLMELFEGILSDNPPEFPDGLCSRA